jgi:chromosome segregation ATPase
MEEIGPREIEKACIDWLRTFSVPSLQVESFKDVRDGVYLAGCLSIIDSSYFPDDLVTAVPTDNWALRAGNLREILRRIEEYYAEVLQKGVDIGSVNCNVISRDGDPDETVNLLELILGAAVQCETKAEFIGQIFELEEMSQLVLKSMVERAMGRTTALENDGNDETDNNEGGGDSEELIRAQEMIKHLQEERQRILNETSSLESINADLSSQITQLTNDLNEYKNERNLQQESDRSRVAVAEQANVNIKMDLDDAKRELDIKMMQIENLEGELMTTKKSLQTTKETTTKYVMEVQMMKDELDVAKDKALQLHKAESSIEKYKARLEEMTDLKKTNKELEKQIDEYLDKINELENGNKNIVILNKKIEEYKDKKIELEREKFEAISALELKEHELGLMKQKFDNAIESKRAIEDELVTTKEALEQSRVELKENKPIVDPDLPSGVSVAMLIEKISQLEHDVREARIQASTPLETDKEVEAVLRAEISDLEKTKIDREQALVASRKETVAAVSEVTNLKDEISKLHVQLNTITNTSITDSATVMTVEAKVDELTSQLSIKDNTLRRLEENLKENESHVNKLQQDKSKLETFAKDSLKNFKDKYLKELTKFRTEKKDWKDKYNAVVKVNERNQETYRREERLLLSSMYEIGVRILDRNIQTTMQEGHSPAGFLASQRAEQEK